MTDKLRERITLLQEQLRQGRIDRRDFLRYVTLLGVSIGAAEALAACAPKETPTTAPPEAPTTAPPEAPTEAPSAPPPTAAPPPPAAVAQAVAFPGFAWNPPYQGLEVDYPKCNGCRICEAACSVKNFGEFNPEYSRIRIHDYYGLIAIPGICWGCQNGGGSAMGGLDAPCIAACPTDPVALVWNEDFAVPYVPDESICIRCGLCYDACPQKAIKENPLTGYPNVCTRCEGDPECVKQCPNGALHALVRHDGVAFVWGTKPLDQTAEEQANHMFYPWQGLEDWKKVTGEV